MLLLALAACVVQSLPRPINPALRSDWLSRWQQNIEGDSHNRYCDKEVGEEIGWLISPFLNGFYEGYKATGDTVWIDRLIDWTDSWLKRGIKEPDGFTGWPKQGSGGLSEDELYSDSLLGEAMGFRPVVLMSGEILSNPRLRGRYGNRAGEYMELAQKTFDKWSTRGCWREVSDGGLWVVPAFGIDKATGQWTSSYADRQTAGFSNPDNKENAIAEWMLAMWDVTHKQVYKQRAEKWFRLMHARMKPADGGKTFVWNYWDPAGPWDYKPDGSTRHWVGVHPNGGYYTIDVAAIVDAYRHHLVFEKTDIDKLISTNRDFMWNQSLSDPKFRRIDGGEADPRWKDSPGVVWAALVPYDTTLQTIFETTLNPGSWGGLSAAPWYLAEGR